MLTLITGWMVLFCAVLQKTHRTTSRFTPLGAQAATSSATLKLIRRKQLAAKLAMTGHDTVAVVDSMPLQLLTGDCDAAQDIDNVELSLASSWQLWLLTSWLSACLIILLLLVMTRTW